MRGQLSHSGAQVLDGSGGGFWAVLGGSGRFLGRDWGVSGQFWAVLGSSEQF